MLREVKFSTLTLVYCIHRVFYVLTAKKSDSGLNRSQ